MSELRGRLPITSSLGLAVESEDQGGGGGGENREERQPRAGLALAAADGEEGAAALADQGSDLGVGHVDH